MFTIHKVTVKKFWDCHNASFEFHDDVNIIIGRNGTGKTTFMNILNAVLSVDIDGLIENDFESVEISLAEGKKRKTIKAKKIHSANTPFQQVEYQVSSRKYHLNMVASDDKRVQLHYRRRFLEASDELRTLLSSFVSLSSLSVYRLRSSEDMEVRDRSGRRHVSPVDYKLTQLTSQLTQYQLELSQKARSISNVLQKDVLASLLYSDAKEDFRFPSSNSFDKNKEKSKLLSAYSRLGALDTGVKKRISHHISSIDTAVNKLNEAQKSKTEEAFRDIDYSALDAFNRTQRIIDKSLDAENDIKELFTEVNLFLSILKDFIPEKKFELENGELTVENVNHDLIPIEKLSSGEKQLLILLIETLLQRRQPHVYLTDEPELSLHIAWQRNIIPAIKQLNRKRSIKPAF